MNIPSYTYVAAAPSSLGCLAHRLPKRFASAWHLKRLGLSVLPPAFLALAGPYAPAAECLWMSVALYGGLIACARGPTLIKLLEIAAAATLGSLALVTIAP